MFGTSRKSRKSLRFVYLTQHIIHLCHYDLQYDKNTTPISGHFQMMTKSTSYFLGACNYKVPANEHELGCWGRKESRAEFRKDASNTAVKGTLIVAAIRDRITLDVSAHPSPIQARSMCTFASSSRSTSTASAEVSKQRTDIVIDDNDDCGTDISSLGFDIPRFGLDTYDSDISDDEDVSTRYHAPQFADSPTYMLQLCRQAVDVLEICGGETCTSFATFRHGVTSGGNLDLTTVCDFVNPRSPRNSQALSGNMRGSCGIYTAL